MAKYSDLVALLEWADRKHTPVKQPKGRSGSKKKSKFNPYDFDLNNFNPFDIAREAKERAARLEQWAKDFEKMSKKEEKKEDKKNEINLSFFQWWIIGLMTYPAAVTVMTWVPK